MIPVAEYVRKLGPHAPIYTYVIHPSGENINLSAELLRQACLKCAPPPDTIPLDHNAFWSFLNHGSICPKRVIELARRPASSLDPVIFCERRTTRDTFEFLLETDKRVTTAFLADGHHRYALSVARGYGAIQGWVVPYKIWKLFIIDGIDDLSAKELQEIPINSDRNY